MPKCTNWVCLATCWNARRMLCFKCAPDVETEMAAAQVQAQVDQTKQKVQQQDLTKGMDLTSEAVAMCPGCGARTQGAKFCPECGKPLRPKAECPKCGTNVEAGTKFCPECGNKMVWACPPTPGSSSIWTSGNAIKQGHCQFRFDAETAIVTPASGTPIAFDLGEWIASCGRMGFRTDAIYRRGGSYCASSARRSADGRGTGGGLARSHGTLPAARRPTGSGALHRDRRGQWSAGPAEIRLYQSNIAVLPLDGRRFNGGWPK